jgi:hypothetical protein
MSTIEITRLAITRKDRRRARCTGGQHEDTGEIVVHDRCGVEVVKNYGQHALCDLADAATFVCATPHTCHPDDVELAAAHRGEAILDSRIVKHTVVFAYRGDTALLGEVGVVAWVSDIDHEPRRARIILATGKAPVVPIDDLRILTTHPRNMAAISQVFEVKNRLAEWEERRAALLAKCQELAAAGQWDELTRVQDQEVEPHTRSKPYARAAEQAVPAA